MRQRDRVGPDAGVGGHPVRGGVVGVAEGVELHERVVAPVHRGLELVEDAVAGIVVDVRRRSLRLGLSPRPRLRRLGLRRRGLGLRLRRAGLRRAELRLSRVRLVLRLRLGNYCVGLRLRSVGLGFRGLGLRFRGLGFGVGHRRGVRHLPSACRGHQGRAHQHPQQPMLS